MEDLVIKNARVIDGTGQTGFVGDVAMSNGIITKVGTVDAAAGRSIEADGRVLTPGFVDIHTHFDGQFCWDKQVTPSCWHGVTTVVAGNCGVGFAPVRPGTEDALVQLMESVEDIPGAALHEGIPWGWESFSEYLDVIDTPYSVDIGTQLAHVAVRHYVMGERCYDDATANDIAEMSAITLEALQAGALGFSTSRFFGHRDKQGELVPGTHASADELIAIGDAVRKAGHGTIEIISDHLDRDEELAWIEHILIESGRPVTVLVNAAPATGLWAMAERLGQRGHQLRPQVGARPPSLLMSLEGTINPMRQFVAYNDIVERPVEAQRRFRVSRGGCQERETEQAHASEGAQQRGAQHRGTLPSRSVGGAVLASKLAGLRARRTHLRRATLRGRAREGVL
jgi:N-acyl-D-amino-acid deacylase